MSKENGFTLLELMIVVSIIGILSAVAIPLYQSNVLKSQLNRAVSELGSYKSAFEYQIANGKPVTNSDINYSPSDLTSGNVRTDIGATYADGSGHLQVTLGSNIHPTLTGLIIRFERNSSGEWGCLIDPSAASGWKDQFSPGSCTVI